MKTVKTAKYKVLSRNTMKFIAMFTMVADHVGLCFIASDTALYFIMRSIIGRIAWPIFAMLMVEGLFRTKHPGEHVLILLVSAIISEPFYDFMYTGTFFWAARQNIMWIYLLTAVFICILRTDRLTVAPKAALAVIWSGASIAMSELLSFSGGWISCAGIFAAALVYLYCHSAVWSSVATGIAWSVTNSNPMCLIPTGISVFYDPDKKCLRSSALKYACYAFYPAHLFMLGLLVLLL